MKKIFITASLALFFMSCKTAQTTTSTTKNQVDVTLDLINVKDDKVMVSVQAPTLTSETVAFNLPKIIPGTYSEDNYGRYIENFKAFDKKGSPLRVAKIDENSYTIYEAQKLDKVTYWVNDTYDTETSGGFSGSDDIFSPAGSNIKAGENFVINTHAFVGYFTGKSELAYNLTVNHPESLQGATSMVDLDTSTTKDIFSTARYNDLVDMPIMYTKSEFKKFMVDDMEILIGIYSPTGKFKAEDITGDIENFMKAQKRFLGKFNSNKKYSILLYLSTMDKDAKGMGALEHMTSTVVVMPEMMPKEGLAEQLKDVVSHEFFHIVTPLSVHSREIHFFDYNSPKMSEHLWMYEGITEYFANLFQVNQGLITEEEFYARMSDKINQAKMMNDRMSFTKMSKNVLDKPYKEQYLNVYQKGALIAMCIDIQLRELSNGQRGILSLMQDLSKEFGSNKPFNDTELFATITRLTYPQIGEFLNKYVAGETPINYDEFFAKMGVVQASIQEAGNPFINKETMAPLISINPTTQEISALDDVSNNPFMTALGIKSKDVILGFNDKTYNLENIYDLIMESENWKEGMPIKAKVKREGKELELAGKVALPKVAKTSYKSENKTKEAVKNAWLKS